MALLTLEQVKVKIEALTADVEWLKIVLGIRGNPEKHVPNQAPLNMRSTLMPVLSQKETELGRYVAAAERLLAQTIEIEEG